MARRLLAYRFCLLCRETWQLTGAGSIMTDAQKPNIGDLLNGMMDELRGNKPAVLRYLAIFIVLTAIAGYLDLSLGLVDQSASQDWDTGFEYGPIGMIVLIASVVGQFWLFGKILGVDVQLSGDNAGRILAFIGLSIVTGLGVMFATVLLIIPGLFVGSRWLMSPAFFVHDNDAVFEAMGKSWNQTRGNTLTIALAAVIIVLCLFVLSLLAAIITFSELMILEAIAGAILGELFTVLFVGLSVTTFRKISDSAGTVSQVFE